VIGCLPVHLCAADNTPQAAFPRYVILLQGYPWRDVEAPVYTFTSKEIYSSQPKTITDWVYVLLFKDGCRPLTNTTSDPYPDVAIARVLTRGELCSHLHHRCRTGAPLLYPGCPPASDHQAKQIMSYRHSVQTTTKNPISTSWHPTQYPPYGNDAPTTPDINSTKAKLATAHGAHTPKTTFWEPD
jgi:hypothetical protein